VLSAGHGSMLLYSLFYLTGYKNFYLEDIKNFRTLGAKTAGHPEKEMFDAIETTTGPLGQGLANAVGMAIAEKKYKTTLGQDICNHKIYAIVGDGCLMEGISYEALSLAGHLNLNNLIVIFDDNGISIDGPTKLTVSEDHLAKCKALGFEVEAINGHNFDQINDAFARAQKASRPYFIACKTNIGQGVDRKLGSEKSHGSPLGANEIQFLKENAAFNLEGFSIPEDLLILWRNGWLRNKEEYDQWQKDFSKLNSAQQKYIEPENILLPNKIEFSVQDEATRVSAGKILEELMANNSKIIAGSADLAGSNNITNKFCHAIATDDFSGNFIYYGVRENAMGAIMNGLALSGFLPIGGTFFVFSDYMKPSIRLAALMGLQVIYIMTHDSIGVGEDGPTHQPIEQLASFRAMPNIQVFRPADFAETRECYELALQNKSGPSMLVLTRQSVPQIREDQLNITRCEKGAYIISETQKQNPDIVIFASGSEVSLALDVKDIIEKSHDVKIRVISIPCFELLAKQPEGYLDNLIENAALIVGIEAASSFGWHKLIGNNGLFFGIDSFGASAPAPNLFKHFGLVAQDIARSILSKF